MNLFNIIFRPELEEDPERTEIAEAANLLQIGEFQLLQLAYSEWFGRDLPEHQLDRLFNSYMVSQQVPYWARHYARRILERERAGRLDANDPNFHRYDRNYITNVPQGVRRFWLAVLCCGGVVFGSVAVATLIVQDRDALSVLPPYFERSEVPGRQ